MEDWNWETIFTDIISLYSTTVTYLASKAIEFGEKRKKGYLRRSRSVKVIEVGTNRKPVCNFLLLINSNGNLSRTVAELSQRIIQILDTLRFEPPLDSLESAYWTSH